MTKAKFNCAILPSSLRGMQSQHWNFGGALSELVDNAFGPGRGDASSVVISHDTRLRTLSILDDGRGMDAIGRLFQLGNTSGRTIGDIGEYGSGGTMALLWCAEKVSVYTLRDGLVQYDTVLWSRWFKASSFDALGVSDEWKRATLNNTPPDLLACKRGTLIVLHMPPKRQLNVSNVIKELSKNYSTGLRKGKRIKWITLRNGQVQSASDLTDPFVSVSREKSVKFNLSIEYGDDILTCRGRVGYDESTTVSESKVHIGYGFRRILSTNDCFHSRDGSQRFIGTGVSGWIDLGEGWQPYLTTTKNGIDDALLYRGLMEHIFEKIRHLLEEAEHKAFAVEFEDLRLGLETALNRRGDNFVIQTGAPDHDGKSGEAAGGRGEAKHPKPDDSHGEKENKSPLKATIRIEQVSDHQMGGALCWAHLVGEEMVVRVNRDHNIVQEALKAKPVNRMALNLMVTGELAAAVISSTDSETFVKKMFSPSFAKEIVAREDERERVRFVQRQLIDRVCRPLAEAA